MEKEKVFGSKNYNGKKEERVLVVKFKVTTRKKKVLLVKKLI
ncbi:MAG TPA: hypothetical protein PKJ39_01690 [Caldisericia bacterium]|nr:hypothetical protein [Caldisericia bacterium]HQL65946.1 hypothetical protein [Caldisericia bacterium]HQN48273.1 hypothetical protein [Caldisericia bacterium]HQO99635.1 hypothetical protein [Caldisericia bacterium]